MSNHPILSMALMTGAGWSVSFSAVESVVRIVSLLVPVILSIKVYRNSRKK